MSPHTRNRLSQKTFVPFDREARLSIDEITCGPNEMEGKYHFDFDNRDKKSYFFALVLNDGVHHLYPTKRKDST